MISESSAAFRRSSAPERRASTDDSGALETGALLVEASPQLGQRHAKRIRELEDRREARISSRALELAHVIASEAGSAGEGVLAEVALAADAAEDWSEDGFRVDLHRTEIFTVLGLSSYKSEMETFHTQTEL